MPVRPRADGLLPVPGSGEDDWAGLDRGRRAPARARSAARLHRDGQQPGRGFGALSLRPDLGRALSGGAHHGDARGPGPPHAGRRRRDPARPRLAPSAELLPLLARHRAGRRRVARCPRAARRLERGHGTGFRTGRDLRGLVRRAREDAGGRARGTSGAAQRGPASSSTPCATGRHWCDDVRTPAVETCAAFKAATLSRAVAKLSRTGSAPDPSGWRWERLHRAVFPHDVFHEVPVLRRFFDLEVGQGGDA